MGLEFFSLDMPSNYGEEYVFSSAKSSEENNELQRIPRPRQRLPILIDIYSAERGKKSLRVIIDRRPLIINQRPLYHDNHSSR